MNKNIYKTSLAFFLIFSLNILFSDSVFPRRIKRANSPIEILKRDGYYISSGFEGRIEDLDIKLVSFDWSILAKREEERRKIEELLKELKGRDIKMVIVSTASKKAIWAAVENYGWDEYFNDDDIYYAVHARDLLFRSSQLKTKAQVLTDITNEKGLAENQIVHFDDDPNVIKGINYKNFFIIGVVEYTFAYRGFKKAFDNLLAYTGVVVSNMSIGPDKILEILNLGK